MGADTSKLGAHSSAKEIIDTCGEGEYLAGKTALVTGGNSGIGLETCKALASAGCKVLLCSRSVDNGKKSIQEELAVDGHGGYSLSPEQLARVQVRQLDLNSLRSVKAFCDSVLEEKLALDYLILNAGVMAFQTREETEDGFEKQVRAACPFTLSLPSSLSVSTSPPPLLSLSLSALFPLMCEKAT